VSVVVSGFDSPETVNQSLNQQYLDLSAKCETMDGFRMMKLYKMDLFWKVVQDTLQLNQKAVATEKKLVQEKDGEITALKTSLHSSKEQVAQLETQVDSLIFLGKEYSKSGFVVLAVVTILLLVGLSTILFIISKSAYKSYREEKSMHEMVFTEFENYKHTAVEKQMKLCRELQDYRNRFNEIKRSA
jgi:hypothetical protein